MGIFMVLFIVLLLAWIFSWAVFHVAGGLIHLARTFLIAGSGTTGHRRTAVSCGRGKRSR